VVAYPLNLWISWFHSTTCVMLKIIKFCALTKTSEVCTITWVSSGLTRKHYTRLERLNRHKHSSLLRKTINNGHKKFYSTGPSRVFYLFHVCGSNPHQVYSSDLTLRARDKLLFAWFVQFCVLSKIYLKLLAVSYCTDCAPFPGIKLVCFVNVCFF